MDLHVDRLSLRLQGLSEADSRRLTRLVAECLASADGPRGALAGAGGIDRLRLRLAVHAGEPLEATARRIATELLSALARSS